MKKTFIIFYLLSAIFSSFMAGQAAAQTKLRLPGSNIDENFLRGKLWFLSSAWFEGRKTGERGNEMAADYLKSSFREIGLKPLNQIRFPNADDNYYYYYKDNLSQKVPLFRFTVSEDEPLTVVARSSGENRHTKFNFSPKYKYLY